MFDNLSLSGVLATASQSRGAAGAGFDAQHSALSDGSHSMDHEWNMLQLRKSVHGQKRLQAVKLISIVSLPGLL